MANAYILKIKSINNIEKTITLDSSLYNGWEPTIDTLIIKGIKEDVFETLDSTSYSFSPFNDTIEILMDPLPELLSIQLVDRDNSSIVSNKLFISFEQYLDDNNSLKSSYLPTSSGKYELNLSMINDADFTLDKPVTIYTSKAPNTSTSSINIPNPNLVKFIGTTYPVSVTLGDVESSPEHLYQVIINEKEVQ